MAKQDNSRFEGLSDWVSQPQKSQAEGVTMKVSNETIKAIEYMSGDSKVIEVLRRVTEMVKGWQPEHVKLMLELAESESDLRCPDDFVQYTNAFSNDRVAQVFIPVLLMQGFHGSKGFERELQKIKGKEIKTQRKTYWMSQESKSELERIQSYLELNKSQTFELMVKCYFRISGAKEEVFDRESYELAVVLEDLMDDLNAHIEQVSEKIMLMRENDPDHFENVDIPKEQLDFCEDDVGWGAVLRNFEVLRNNFQKHIHNYSRDLPNDFLPK